MGRIYARIPALDSRVHRDRFSSEHESLMLLWQLLTRIKQGASGGRRMQLLASNNVTAIISVSSAKARDKARWARGFDNQPYSAIDLDFSAYATYTWSVMTTWGGV